MLQTQTIPDSVFDLIHVAPIEFAGRPYWKPTRVKRANLKTQEYRLHR